MKSRHLLKILTLALVTNLAIISTAVTQEGQAGTESIFKAGFGARAASMGEAFTAAADDPTAVFWNPAGLEYVYQQSVSLYHMSLFEGTLYDFIGYTLPTLRIGTFGVGIGRVGIGDIEQTDEFNNPLGTFAWEEYQAFFGYAKKLPWNLTIGTTVRVVYRSWGGVQEDSELTDYGIGADLGVLYKPDMFTNTLLRDWTIGLSVRNLFPPQLGEGDEIDAFPLTARLGLGRKIHFGGGGNSLNLLLDLDYSQQRDMRIHFGTEYTFRELGMIRAGYDGAGPTFGAGVKYKFMQLDYAYGNSSYGDYFPAVHKISLSFNFGLNREQLFEIAEAERLAEEERLIADMRERDRQKFINEHLQSADDYFEQGDWFNATVDYQQVISQDPFNQRANIMLDSANVLLQQRFESQQAVAVRNALDTDRAERDRAYIDEHFEKARNLLDQKQFTEALMEFNLVLERDPGNQTVLDGIATTNRRITEETNRLIRLGRQEFQNRNYAEALRLLAEARLLGGGDQQIQNEVEPLVRRIELQEKIQKGLNLYELGEYDQALNVFEEALVIDPEDELVKQYYEKSKIETVGKTETMDPQTRRQYLKGVDHFVKGQYKAAIQVWEEILKEYPYNKEVLTGIKSARERLKQESN